MGSLDSNIGLFDCDPLARAIRQFRFVGSGNPKASKTYATDPFVGCTGALSGNTVSARAKSEAIERDKNGLRIADHQISFEPFPAYMRSRDHSAVRHEPGMTNVILIWLD